MSDARAESSGAMSLMRAVERNAGARLGAGERDDLGDRQVARGWEEIRHATGLERSRGRDQNRAPPPNWKNCVRSYACFRTG